MFPPDDKAIPKTVVPRLAVKNWHFLQVSMKDMQDRRRSLITTILLKAQNIQKTKQLNSKVTIKVKHLSQSSLTPNIYPNFF